MVFHFDFTKDTISKNVGEFLLENLQADERIILGKKLQYQDANTVLLHMNVFVGNKELDQHLGANLKKYFFAKCCGKFVQCCPYFRFLPLKT